ncbi:acyl-CoA dehydrogenase family protein [Mycolicibacterium pyrenivorans]|uniref:acyl-CoA dehydrogenase family protein n=1 Tax=Mycolicibacterium pyrenivorans TaxID=187102 RepID=UPI0021F28E11|nr:acyl-CoA dehydrogenase family protein [Mycolicibacterium pyrenivorans]MCV7154767.1 acyl-CoA/acyl-ACP dehydrogenase [Mycolicibacterium pyrenivorans]
MQTAEVKELQNSLRSLFDTVGDDPAAISRSLDELGWDEVVAEEPRAWTLLFEEIGRAGIAVQLLDVTVLSTLGIDSRATAVGYPITLMENLFAPSAPISGNTVTVHAVVRTLGAAPERVLIPIASEPTAVLLVPTSELDLRPVSGLDQAGGWTQVSQRLTPHPSWLGHATAGWSDAVASARRLLAAELVGLARAALQLAAEHVTQRRQFGKAIGSFQAVRFRLADAKAAIEAAAEAIRVADVDSTPLSAAIAKALAGAAADTAVRNAAQVCGAMGLTWEFGLHSIIRRSYALDVLLGSTAELITAFGRRAAYQVHAGDRVTAPDPLLVSPCLGG